MTCKGARLVSGVDGGAYDQARPFDGVANAVVRARCRPPAQRGQRRSHTVLEGGKRRDTVKAASRERQKGRKAHGRAEPTTDGRRLARAAAGAAIRFPRPP